MEVLNMIKAETRIIRSGYDGKSCIVHARCCKADGFMVATAQNLDVRGMDSFSGIMVSTSTDEGKTWTQFRNSPALGEIIDGEYRTVASDMTPMYHKKTGKVILIGHTVEYKIGELHPTGRSRYTSYSVFDSEKMDFTSLHFLDMPEGYECCGNGSGQSLELDNGDILVPVYFRKPGGRNSAMVLRCSFDGEKLELLEMGNPLAAPVARGLGEPSLVYHRGEYYMTLRNDELGFVAKSSDGLIYDECHAWRWDDESLVDTYNTQQHFMKVGDELYLVYTRRGANNDHVFRHRAPLFAARVEDMKLVRASEIAIIPERGARLGNFGVTQLYDGRAAVMAAEWMQPVGCEKYGCDNSIFFSVISEI